MSVIARWKLLKDGAKQKSAATATSPVNVLLGLAAKQEAEETKELASEVRNHPRGDSLHLDSIAGC